MQWWLCCFSLRWIVWNKIRRFFPVLLIFVSALLSISNEIQRAPFRVLVIRAWWALFVFRRHGAVFVPQKIIAFGCFLFVRLLLSFFLELINHQIATKKSLHDCGFLFFLSLFFKKRQIQPYIFVQLRVIVPDLTKQFQELAHLQNEKWINVWLTCLSLTTKCFNYSHPLE